MRKTLRSIQQIVHSIWSVAQVDLVVLATLLGMVLSVPGAWQALGLPSPSGINRRVQVPIPADKLTGSTDALHAQDGLEIIALVPNSQGTPVAQTFTNLQVRELLDGGQTVVLAASSTQAQALQEALITEKASFTYRVLAGTATPTPPSTATLPPSPTPTPPEKHLYVQLEAGEIDPHPARPEVGPARLVVVERAPVPLPLPAEWAPAVPTPPSGHTAIEWCVTVQAFLHESGRWLGAYDEKLTTAILVEMEVDHVAELAPHLTGAERIYLFNDSECR